MNINVNVAASVNNSVMNNNFKEFNLNEAKKGAKLVTRDGRKAKFICVSRDKISVILTSEPNNYSSKAEFLKCHPEYRMTGSWKEVKIVFTNSLESNTGKMKKAREKNIEIKLY